MSLNNQQNLQTVETATGDKANAPENEGGSSTSAEPTKEKLGHGSKKPSEMEDEEFMEWYRADEEARPWKDRLYRHFNDTRANPDILTAEQIEAGGMCIDIESGESLSVAIVTPAAKPPNGMSQEEYLELLEKYRLEMENAGTMPLPDDDDADL